MADFTQMFLQGLQAGQAQKKSAEERQQQIEELKLRKEQLAHQAKAQALQIKELEQRGAKQQFDFMQGAPAPVGDISQGVSGVQGGGQFDLGAAISAAQQGQSAPRMDTSTMQPTGKLPEVTMPSLIEGQPAVTRRPQTQQEVETERQQKAQIDLKTAFETAYAKKAGEARAPMSEDQRVDNERLAQQARDTADLRRSEIETRRMNAQSLNEFRNTTLELRKMAVEDARAKFEAGRDPATIRGVADQIMSRKITLNDLNMDQRKMVLTDLVQRGLNIPRKLTALELQAQNNAIAGLAAVQTVKQMLTQDPDLPNKSWVPGLSRVAVKGASEYNTAKREMADVLARIRTGAAINNQEMAFYGDQAPKALDPPAAIDAKMRQYEGLFLAASGVPVVLVSPDGKQEAVIQDGYDPKQRLTMRQLISKGWNPEY